MESSAISGLNTESKIIMIQFIKHSLNVVFHCKEIKQAQLEFDYNKTYYKIVDETMKNYNFEFKEGLNVLDESFNPKGECTSGGFYFCNLENIVEWLYLHPNGFIFEVNIPPTGNVIKQLNKFKTNALILKNPLSFKTFIKKYNLELLAVKEAGLNLKYIDDQTDDICLEAVKQDGVALKYVTDQTDEICLEAIQNDCEALQYVDYDIKTEDFCLCAINNDPYALKYADTQTESMCLIAIKQNPHLIQYVQKQTENICIEAVKQDGFMLVHIKKQSINTCIKAVQQNGLALKYVINQHKIICIEAIRQNIYSFQFIKKYTEDICLEAARLDGMLLEKINEQTDNICLQACKQNKNAIKYIKDANHLKFVLDELQKIEI
jgi:hypothetical protein